MNLKQMLSKHGRLLRWRGVTEPRYHQADKTIAFSDDIRIIVLVERESDYEPFVVWEWHPETGLSWGSYHEKFHTAIKEWETR